MKELTAVTSIFASLVALVAPFIYHIVWSIKMASETGSAIALLIIGVVIPPVGWAHGVSLLLGWSWI